MVAGITTFDETETELVAREPPSQLLHFPRSDGNPESRPSAEQRDRTVEHGQVNYHRSVNVNEVASRGWREKIGGFLARELGKDTTQKWYIADWPPGYELFVQLKGPADNPRHDMYLFGGRSRFRSANEFNPHALWLFRGEEAGPCQCRYCTKGKSQRDINSMLGLSQGAPSPTPIPGPSSSSTSLAKPIRRQPIRSSPTAGREVYEVRDRESDLWSERVFRPGEVVWCHLDTPITGNTAQDKIEWWPALIQDHNMDCRAVPITPGQPYTVQQFLVYRVKLFGVASNGRFEESQILPYHAHVPSDHILDCLPTARPPPPFVPDLTSFAHFSPLSTPFQSSITSPTQPGAPPIPRTFQNALAPYSLGIHTAAHVGNYWCPSDPWEFISHPTPSTPSMKQIRFQGLWWGCERIWVGDLVRIKSDRSLLHGDILDCSSPFSAARGLLVRINAIYLQQVPVTSSNDSGPTGGPTTKSDIFFAGSLYEVADLDVPIGSEPGSSTQPYPNPSSPYPMPPPPQGYQWRLLAPSSNIDIHLHLTQLSGRYYPTLVQSPLIADAFNPTTINHYIANGQVRISAPPIIPPSNPTRTSARGMCQADWLVQKILALSGLVPGVANPVECTIWAPSRTHIFESASGQAKADLYNYWTKVTKLDLVTSRRLRLLPPREPATPPRPSNAKPVDLAHDIFGSPLSSPPPSSAASPQSKLPSSSNPISQVLTTTQTSTNDGTVVESDLMVLDGPSTPIKHESPFKTSPYLKRSFMVMQGNDPDNAIDVDAWMD